MKNQRGIALIQILLISAILSVLALYLTKTARNQVAIAQWLDDKSQALVNVHNAENEMLFNLFTHERVNTSKNINVDSIENKWNFYGTPFDYDRNTRISIQDQAGLIHANFPQIKYLRLLVKSLGYSDIQVNEIVSNLLDWQDVDSISRVNGSESGLIRNGNVPDLHEFQFVQGVTPELLKVLIAYTTIYRSGDFNPTNSPEFLLQAITNINAAKKVIELRNNRQLTKKRFTEITGITEDDGIFFYPSNYLEVVIKSEVGESIATKKIIINVEMYASGKKEPLNILFSSN